MESDNSLSNQTSSDYIVIQNNQLSSDNRCYSLFGPILNRYEPVFSEEIYGNNFEPMECSIDYIIEKCKKNKSIVLEESIVDFATICNKIVCSLFHGSQMQYEKDSYTKAYNSLNDWSNSIRDLSGTITNTTENNSAVFFNEELTNKDITVSSNFLKQLEEAIKDTNFKVFDNPNYLNTDINLRRLFKYLGNRVLQLARNAFNNMYYKIQSPEFSNSKNKKEYLDKSIFSDIILPFYYNLNKIKDSLYELENYITCKDYDKTLLNKQLKSTADYINDVLNNSKIYMYDYYNKNYNELKNIDRIRHSKTLKTRKMHSNKSYQNYLNLEQRPQKGIAIKNPKKDDFDVIDSDLYI